jgi:hypothetical protein
MEKLNNVPKKMSVVLSLFAIIICLCCISCSNSNKSVIIKNTNPPSGDATQMNLSMVEDCLRNFINLNISNKRLIEFNLNLDTLKGNRLQQEDNIWFLGKWTIEGDVQEPIAYLAINYTNSESTRLILFLSKQNDVYKVIKWEIEDTF